MQKITVTLTVSDGIDAGAFVAALAERARYAEVAVGTREETITRTVTVWASPEDITFVSVETVADPEPAGVTA